jgi:hypothetical protein
MFLFRFPSTGQAELAVLVQPNAVMAHSDATLRSPTAAAHGMPGYVSADSGVALADRQSRCSCSFRCCYLQFADLLTGVCIRQGAPGPLLAEVRHSLQLAYFSIIMRSQQAQLLPAQPAGSSRGFWQLMQGAHTAGVAQSRQQAFQAGGLYPSAVMWRGQQGTLHSRVCAWGW